MLARSDPEAAKKLLHEAQEDVKIRWCLYENWAAMSPAGVAEEVRK
jgi:hypothetical protein